MQASKTERQKRQRMYICMTPIISTCRNGGKSSNDESNCKHGRSSLLPRHCRDVHPLLGTRSNNRCAGNAKPCSPAGSFYRQVSISCQPGAFPASRGALHSCGGAASHRSPPAGRVRLTGAAGIKLRRWHGLAARTCHSPLRPAHRTSPSAHFPRQ